MSEIPKLKKTLYIGLGGTGFKTLVHTKKAFIETYGEVPPMIKFLAFDSDVNQEGYTLPSIFGEVSLAPSERQSLSVQHAKAKVEHNRNLLTWLPDKNLRAVVDLVNGCGMVRTNGRIAFSFNYVAAKNAIQNALSGISLLKHVHDDRYGLLGSDVEANLVFSIAGGTGAGTFIDMAYLVKNVFESNGLPETSKIVGYMVLPDVYDTQLTFGKERLMPNALGALVDLDYLSHQEFTDGVMVNYLTDFSQLKGTPFNTIFTIGNTNSNGDVVIHSDTLSQMMSLAMVVSAGELSSGVASVANNLERDMNSGDYDIKAKRAILSTLGMSEITFRASELKNLYTVKAAREFAAALLNPGNNADIDANSWIDELQIRENNGRDDVIDYLLSKMPKVVFQEISDDANPRSDVDSYRQQDTVAVDNNTMTQKITALEEKVQNALLIKIKDIVDVKGPAYAQDFIGEVRNQIGICMGEMQNERQQFIGATNIRESAISTAIEEYRGACKRIFGRARAKEEASEALSTAVTAAVVNDREIHRRNGAITFYTWLLNLLNSTDTYLTKIIDNVRSACQLISRQISEINAQLNSSRGIFEIDLTRPYVDQVKVDSQDVVLSQYVNSLPEGKKIYEFGNLSPQQIANSMTEFAHTLQPEVGWDKMSVEDALAQLPKQTAEDLIRKAIKLASPMCTLNFRGHLNRELLNYYYIGVHEQSTTGLGGKILQVCDCIDGNSMYEVSFSSIGSRDRIVIFHQYGVFPTFAIGKSQSYRHAHDKYLTNPNSYSCFLDENLRVKMERNGFSVIPKEPVDNSLEMWVKGLIFGLITRDNEGIYYFRDEDNDETALDGYITSLRTPYRDEAFREFKTQVERLLPQYERIINEWTKQRGQEALDAKLSDARSNYLEKYSLNRYSLAELKNPLYQNIRKQLTDEVNFAKKEL